MQDPPPHAPDASALPTAEDAATLPGLRRAARFLDASVGVPGTSWRVGADSLLGLVPVVGDGAGLLLSLGLVAAAARHGVRVRTLVRMLVNVAVDAVLGAPPILGDLFDAWFHANLRNVRLAERDLAAQAAEARA